MSHWDIHIAPFQVRLRSALPLVAAHLQRFYAYHPASLADEFVDFDIEVEAAHGLRRLWRPQARFLLDGHEHFFPLPADQAAPLFEWGLNWCVAQRELGYLVMHAAVVARGDRALMLPGSPGAGKSTLCASLVFAAQWRLLSDELAILDPATGALWPHPRPISLKNESIAIVKGFTGSEIGPIYHDTRKGSIAHAACPAASIVAAGQPAFVNWLVFPRFVAGAAAACESISRAEAFVRISEQSFNRERMGETGFRAVCDLLTRAECFEVTYGSTRDGLELIERVCDS